MVHLALGYSLPDTGGENRSRLHWDPICDLRMEAGSAPTVIQPYAGYILPSKTHPEPHHRSFRRFVYTSVIRRW
jgi:hypothetical protein